MFHLDAFQSLPGAGFQGGVGTSPCCQQHLQGPAFGEFVTRLLRLGCVTRAGLVVSLVYMFRIRTRAAQTPNPAPRSTCNHCTYVGCLVLSCKFLEDTPLRNSHWAQLTNMSTKRVSEIERCIFSQLDYKLSVQETHFQLWTKMVYGRAPSPTTSTGNALSPTPVTPTNSDNTGVLTPPYTPPAEICRAQVFTFSKEDQVVCTSLSVLGGANLGGCVETGEPGERITVLGKVPRGRQRRYCPYGIRSTNPAN
eukprot:comp23076_c1_seq1/m.37008 comp23076_c1_seq1/g.37008  ORF comp23076_c1_seq1/g.37008 comp23076_c1_seq1/m.37008 type:complete len:252 (-) comp23076_c1_seq1:361-1116(-)